MEELPGVRKKVCGCLCEVIAPQTWGWRHSSGCWWTLELPHKRLYCNHELVAQGTTLPYAVAFSLGYETAVADMVRGEKWAGGKAQNKVKPSAILLPFERPIGEDKPG